MAAVTIIRVQQETFDAAVEAAKLTAGRADLGAVVTFTGLCRDEGGALEALEIEHYPGMAEAEIGRIAAEAAARWPVECIFVAHRHGRIAPGEPIVLVITASAHREAAFAAASFLMDFMKTQAPFWKKQHFAPSAEPASPNAPGVGWVEAKPEDDRAAGAWRGESAAS